MSHASQDEWGKCDGSKKGLDYKQMRYLTFAPVSELEQVIFEKCSFDQPPLSHPSPLRASDKPSPSSKSTYSTTTRWLQQSQKNINHFWKKGHGPGESSMAVSLHFQCVRGLDPVEVPKVMDTT